MRRLKRDVMAQLPAKRRQVVRLPRPAPGDWPISGASTCNAAHVRLLAVALGVVSLLLTLSHRQGGRRARAPKRDQQPLHQGSVLFSGTGCCALQGAS